MSDLYDLLGVARTATTDELKSAWREAARRLHPDRNRDDPGATERFSAVSAAWQVLSDPERRRQYDQYGEDAASAFFHEAKVRRRAPTTMVHGADVEYELRLSVHEAARGGRKDLARGKPVPCPACDGTGWRRAGRACSKCDAGMIGGKPTLAIPVPRHAQNGQVLRIVGAGESGTGRGARPGDLLVTLVVAPDFRRDGDLVGVAVPVPAAVRIAGGEVSVPLENGETTTIRIPANAKLGLQLRLEGMAEGGGDLIAVVVDLPASRVIQAMRVSVLDR
jgi:DnaJ-class molecular chaperone